VALASGTIAPTAVATNAIDDDPTTCRKNHAICVIPFFIVPFLIIPFLIIPFLCGNHGRLYAGEVPRLTVQGSLIAPHAGVAIWPPTRNGVVRHTSCDSPVVIRSDVQAARIITATLAGPAVMVHHTNHDTRFARGRRERNHGAKFRSGMPLAELSVSTKGQEHADETSSHATFAESNRRCHAEL
jgi:hypothetical protein